MKSVKAVIDRRILIPLTVILLIGVVYINLPMHVKVSIDNYDPTISDKKLIRIYSNMIDALRKPKRNSNLYRKRPETEHVDCGKVLRKDKNNDVIIKSIYEIERIFEIFGGANDVNIVKEIGERRVSGLKWDPMKSLIDRKVLLEPMKVVSGSVQSSWSRAAVKWLIEDVDLTIAINQFNKTVISDYLEFRKT
uniref:DUF2939 domain-containing protein n=1 Tax=Caenorhabditis tropicalis TaxID=1561998 RepID=A0A1I7V015_9PELO